MFKKFIFDISKVIFNKALNFCGDLDYENVNLFRRGFHVVLEFLSLNVDLLNLKKNFNIFLSRLLFSIGLSGLSSLQFWDKRWVKVE